VEFAPGEWLTGPVLRPYPDALGYGERFEQIVRTWRPALATTLAAEAGEGEETL
jgi:hypothetical protein